jgi:hypothetical protein
MDRSYTAIKPAKPRLERCPALRILADLLVMAADEAPNRNSAGLLRDASARVFDALACERGALQ